MPGPPLHGDALDQLQYEDEALRELLKAFDDPTLDRSRHGQVGKLLVEHLAVREAARELVADALEATTELAWAGRELRSHTERRRRELARLDEMARGIAPVNLDQAQDFTRAVAELRDELLEEIGVDLERVVPAARQLPPRRRKKLLPSARYVRSHAPTHPGDHPRRWYDRVGALVRLHALYDVLRGFPTGGARPSAEVDVGNDNRPV